MKADFDHSADFVIPISYGSTEVIQTGQWGFQKPQSSLMTAPCQEACPAGNPIPQFLYLAAEGRHNEAFQTLIRENPFPGVCGRVCFHPCETDCNRGKYDESVSIRAMERYISEAASNQDPNFKPIENKDSKKVAIVGAGPAGLSCAYFLFLLGHRVTIFEAKSEPGGTLRWGIPEYRLPRAVLKREIQRILRLPIEIKTGITLGGDLSFDKLDRFDAIFLSPGARVNTALSINGEDLKRVWKGGDFLEKVNSKEKITLGRKTLVVGGGNTAIDVARAAIRLGSRATVAYRRTRNEMPAIPDEIIEAEEEGVRFEFLIQPVEIRRFRNNGLAVKFQRMKLGDPDRSGRPKAMAVKGKFITLEADRLITAVGEQVDLSWIPQQFVKEGLIQMDPSSRVFAGGDAVDQPRTVVTAIASGKKAAISIDLSLRGCDQSNAFSKIKIGNRGAVSMEAYLSWREEGRWPEPKKIISYDEINTLFFEHSSKINTRKLGVARRVEGFSEVNRGLSSKEAGLSASRCFSCGTCNYCYNCYFFCPEGAISLDPIHGTKTVDLDHCKGCGTCAKSCPRSVVEMKEFL